MFRKFLILALFGLGLCSGYTRAQDSESQPRLVLREGKQVRDDTVAVEITVFEDIIQARIEVRMLRERPKISNVLLVGPKLGRMIYTRKEEIPVSLEEGDPYLVSEKGGIFSSRNKKEYKNPKGTLTAELFQFKVPLEKLVKGKKYQLWVDVEGKNSAGKTPLKFKFDLPDLAAFF